MEPKDIENPQAEDDFRHQLRAEKEVIKISSNLPVLRSFFCANQYHSMRGLHSGIRGCEQQCDKCSLNEDRYRKVYDSWKGEVTKK